MQPFSSPNLSKLVLLGLSSLPTSAFSMTNTAAEKLIFWFERNSIPESVENYATNVLNIDLNSDEGRQQILLLLLKPDIEDMREASLFKSLEEKMLTLSPEILDGLVSTIMVQEIEI